MSTCTSDPIEQIGYEVSIERRYIDGVLDGIAYWHPDGKGGTCSGYVFPERVIEGEKHGWLFVSERPLHLEPSLLCRICNHHGFIRDGRWVPA